LIRAVVHADPLVAGWAQFRALSHDGAVWSALCLYAGSRAAWAPLQHPAFLSQAGAVLQQAPISCKTAGTVFLRSQGKCHA
jgi:hypothetical protein